MQKFTSFTFGILFGIAAFGLIISPARATVILNIDANGQLLGAQNVDVLGTLYDVTFVDGTCIALFNGCDELADFDFNDATTALAAAQALLDQVFIDTAFGSFDTNPELTTGCENPDECLTIIPFSLPRPDLFGLAAAINRSPTFRPPDFTAQGDAFRTTDWTKPSGDNLAIFTPITVPEPSALLLFAVGLVGMAGFWWRRTA